MSFILGRTMQLALMTLSFFFRQLASETPDLLMEALNHGWCLVVGSKDHLGLSDVMEPCQMRCFFLVSMCIEFHPL